MTGLGPLGILKVKTIPAPGGTPVKFSTLLTQYAERTAWSSARYLRATSTGNITIYFEDPTLGAQGITFQGPADVEFHYSGEVWFDGPANIDVAYGY